MSKTSRNYAPFRFTAFSTALSTAVPAIAERQAKRETAFRREQLCRERHRLEGQRDAMITTISQLGNNVPTWRRTKLQKLQTRMRAVNVALKGL